MEKLAVEKGVTSQSLEPRLVRDPVCGMEIEVSQAATTHTVGQQAFYFCSKHCAKQFEQQQAISATTGVGQAEGLNWLELPVSDLKDRHGSDRLVEQLTTLAGVDRVAAHSTTRLVGIAYDPKQISLADITGRIEAEGYQVGKAPLQTEASLDREEQDRAREYRTLMHKFWFAAAISIPVIIFSYPEFFPGVRDWLPKGSDLLRLVWGLLGLLTLPVLIWSGNQFFSGAWAALKHRQANMHTLISIGVSAAWLYSTVAVLFPTIFPSMELAEVFYDVSSVVTALVVLGLALELPKIGPK